MDSFEHPASGDSLSLKNNQISLSGRQLAILDLLHQINPQLGLIYRGAWEIYLLKPTNYIATSAHGFRELIEKSYLWKGERIREPSIKEAIKGKIAQVWQPVQKNLAQGALFSNQEYIEVFAKAFSDFYDTFCNDFPSRMDQAAIALRNLQNYREDLVTFHEDKRKLHELYQLFTSLSHHDVGGETKLFNNISELEGILLKYLRPGESEKYDAIESIVQKTENPPSFHHLNDINRLIDNWVDRETFYLAIKDGAWITMLFQNSWFHPESESGPYISAPNRGLSECMLLLKFTGSHPEIVQKAALQLVSIDNPITQSALLKIAANLPGDLGLVFIPFATSIVQTAPPYSLHYSLEEYLVYLLLNGISVEVAEFISLVIQICPDSRSDEKIQEHKGGGISAYFVKLEPTSRWELYQYQEMLGKISSSVRPEDRLAILEIYAKVLSVAVDLSIWPDIKERTDGYDESEDWRPVIESDENNDTGGYPTQLVTAIRDIAENIISSNPEQFSDVEKILEEPPWLIFKRLNLHLLRKYSSDSSTERIRRKLLDENLRESPAWREWAPLLKEHFHNLDEDDQSAILNWIETGYDARGRIDQYKQCNHGENPTAELIEEWRHYWQVKRLSRIAGDLPPLWKARYDSMSEKYGEYNDLEYHNPGSGVFIDIHQKSPLRADEVRALSISELLLYLKEWKQSSEFDGHSENGLIAALRTAGNHDPNHFLQQIRECRELLPARYLAILEGCFEGTSTHPEVHWDSLFLETEWAIHNIILPLSSADNVDIGLDIIKKIEAVLKSIETPPPIRNRESILNCLKLLLLHPEPKMDWKDCHSPGNLTFTSLNSSRLIAIRSMFDYARWVRKSLNSNRDDNPTPEFLEIIEEHLKVEVTLAGRGIYGEELGWLLQDYREWVIRNMEILFPSVPEQKEHRDAVWNCFVSMNRPFDAAFEVLQNEYRRAIHDLSRSQGEGQKKSGEWLPENGLVRHLASFYWWGKIPLPEIECGPDSLMELFYEKARLSDRLYLLIHIGKSLRTTSGKIPKRIQKRFIDLIEWRISKIEMLSESQGDEVDELEGYLRWFDAKRMDPEWSMKTLLRVLKLDPKCNRRDDFFIFKPLAEYSNQLPDLAMQCLHYLTFSSPSTPEWWGLHEEIKTILRNGFSSENLSTKNLAAAVKNHLLKLGRMQFRTPEISSEAEAI